MAVSTATRWPNQARSHRLRGRGTPCQNTSHAAAEIVPGIFNAFAREWIAKRTAPVVFDL
jgi:hypothetical protein